jgi:hypothetical protein
VWPRPSSALHDPSHGATIAGTWSDLANQPGASFDTMLLLSDGTVIAHASNSPNWHQLTHVPMTPTIASAASARQSGE